MRVDITEVIGLPARGCPRAKKVMRKFINTSPPVMGDGQVRVDGRTYSCYRSRLDGEGWDYHCNWSSPDRAPVSSISVQADDSESSPRAESSSWRPAGRRDRALRQGRLGQGPPSPR